MRKQFFYVESFLIAFLLTYFAARMGYLHQEKASVKECS